MIPNEIWYTHYKSRNATMVHSSFFLSFDATRHCLKSCLPIYYWRICSQVIGQFQKEINVIQENIIFQSLILYWKWNQWWLKLNCIRSDAVGLLIWSIFLYCSVPQMPFAHFFIIMILPRHNSAHAMTAELPWYVQNWHLISQWFCKE